MSIDLNKYKKEVEEIIKYSQSYPFDLDCTNIIEKWYKNKKYFIDLFDGKTRVEFSDEEEFSLDEYAQTIYFDDFIQCLIKKGLGEQSYEGISVRSFLVLNQDSFFKNKVSNIPDELKHQSKIRSGDKLIKSLKFFYKDKHDLKIAQNLASQYIQKNKVKGKLYLSVDPIDYLLASENNENWRSCHALDGDFRCGNLSYMLDGSTVIAYVSNGEKQTMNMLPDNYDSLSKKLRVFIHWTATSAALFFSKTYPFDAPNLRNKIQKYVNKLYEDQLLKGKISSEEFCEFTEPELVGFNKIELPLPNNGGRYLDENWMYYDGNIINLYELIEVPKGSLNYNDILNSSSYQLYICAKDNCFRWAWHSGSIKDTFRISIGESVPCATGCGNYVEENNNFICLDCAHKLGMDGDYFLHCYDCGRRLFPEDNIYQGNCWGEEVTYCEKCYDPDYDYE